MPRSHLHVKLSHKTCIRPYLGTTAGCGYLVLWQLQGLHGTSGSVWRLLSLTVDRKFLKFINSAM